MKARVFFVRQISPEDEAAWRALSTRAIEQNPLFEPDCLIPAADHQVFGSEIQLVVAEEDGRFFGALPVRNVTKWRRLRYRVATTQVRRMIYSGTPLIDADRGGEAVAAILRGLADDHRSWLLDIRETYDSGPVGQAIREGAEIARMPLFRFDAFERGVLSRREGESYKQIHSRKSRHEIERVRRRAAEAFGSLPSIVERAGDPSAIDDYMALEAKGYKAKIGVALSTVAGEPEWFRDMCARFAAAGRLHVPTLVAGKQILAMGVWIRSGEGIFMLKSSFAEEYAAFNPGKIHHLLSQAYLHEETDAAWLETCTFANNELLERLYPDRQQIASFLVPLSRNPIHSWTARAFIRAARSHTTHVEKRSAVPAARRTPRRPLYRRRAQGASSR